jgi:ABC-type glutathione transport system ATPase component
MTALELRAVSKMYGEGASKVHALRAVDLSVDAGELVAVMGPSGSGKSTLLTIADSLEQPTTGEVLVDGNSLSTMSRNDQARLRRRSIGYMFQDFNLLAGLTAVETSLCRWNSTAYARRPRTRRVRMRWSSSASPIADHGFRTSCLVANVNGWPSLAPWSVTVTSCSPTSPPARSIRSTPRP